VTSQSQGNTYSFPPFLEKVQGIDFYRDDPFVRKMTKHYAGHDWPSLNQKLLAFSPRVSFSKFPLAAKQLKEIVRTTQRTTAGAFKVYDVFLRQGGMLQGGLSPDNAGVLKKAQFDLRELIILQKPVTEYEAVDVIRKAISLFGGHGVIEDFSALPRLFRDAMVNELWEGPRNVLLMQVFRDLQRVAAWYPPEEFVANILEGAPKDLVQEFSSSLRRFLDNPPSLEPNESSMRRAADWEIYCENLFRMYQELALDEVGAAPIFSDYKLDSFTSASESPPAK
jgi:hypothetical protein